MKKLDQAYGDGRHFLIDGVASHIKRPPDLSVYTDASSLWGCGGVWEKEWFQCQWSRDWEEKHIVSKELVPIVIATGLWGPRWHGKHVLVHSDNAAVVEVLHADPAEKIKTLLHLLRCLHFISAHHIRISATHIPGKTNWQLMLCQEITLMHFFLVQSSANLQPTQVPHSLWRLVVKDQPNWLSPV